MQKKTIWYIILFIILAEFTAGDNRITSMLHHPLETIMMLTVLLIGLTVHEFAHAWMADRLGDPNPRLAGRVSLNPLVHLDPFGTLLIILTGFGWGKPVQFDPYNLTNPDKDGAVIAAAGPISNIILAIVSALSLRFIPLGISLGPVGQFLFLMFQYNINLAVFNLIPIYPLDGHHILRAFLDAPTRQRYDIFNRSVGMYLALVSMLPLIGGRSLVSLIMTPAINFAYMLFMSL